MSSRGYNNNNRRRENGGRVHKRNNIRGKMRNVDIQDSIWRIVKRIKDVVILQRKVVMDQVI